MTKYTKDVKINEFTPVFCLFVGNGFFFLKRNASRECIETAVNARRPFFFKHFKNSHQALRLKDIDNNEQTLIRLDLYVPFL